jgi:hypothetical protein
MFESWLPMDSDIFGKNNCNARRSCDQSASALGNGDQQLASAIHPEPPNFDGLTTNTLERIGCS